MRKQMTNYLVRLMFGKVINKVCGCNPLNMKPVGGKKLNAFGGYTPMSQRSEKAQEVARELNRVWEKAQYEMWPTFHIHGVSIKAPDKKAAIHKYNKMKSGR